MAFSKLKRRAKIKRRIRKNIFGTSNTPRLSVFRSNKEIYAQLVDDNAGTTLVSVSSRYGLRSISVAAPFKVIFKN